MMAYTGARASLSQDKLMTASSSCVFLSASQSDLHPIRNVTVATWQAASGHYGGHAASVLRRIARSEATFLPSGTLFDNHIFVFLKTLLLFFAQ